jgi:hypothetical protein
VGDGQIKGRFFIKEDEEESGSPPAPKPPTSGPEGGKAPEPKTPAAGK